jgi:predicted ATPase
MLKRLKFTNYRPYQGENEIVFKKLNFFYGFNSSGKSALLKLLKIIRKPFVNRYELEKLGFQSYMNNFEPSLLEWEFFYLHRDDQAVINADWISFSRQTSRASQGSDELDTQTATNNLDVEKKENLTIKVGRTDGKVLHILDIPLQETTSGEMIIKIDDSEVRVKILYPDKLYLIDTLKEENLELIEDINYIIQQYQSSFKHIGEQRFFPSDAYSFEEISSYFPEIGQEFEKQFSKTADGTLDIIDYSLKEKAKSAFEDYERNRIRANLGDDAKIDEILSATLKLDEMEREEIINHILENEFFQNDILVYYFLSQLELDDYDFVLHILKKSHLFNIDKPIAFGAYLNTDWSLSAERQRDQFVPVTQMGYGISQVMPIIAYLSGQNIGNAVIIQPESFLHPEGEMNIAKAIINLYKYKPPKPTLFIETHSQLMVEYILASVEKDPSLIDTVGINFINKMVSGTKIVNIQIYEDGDTSPWPRGYFSQLVKIRSELL